LSPCLAEAVGYTPLGTFSTALSPDGGRLFVTWNGSRGGPDRRGRNKLFENRGARFRDISQGNPACIVLGGRSIGILDADLDGLLDLFVCEDWWTGGAARLFRNSGALNFEDRSREAGLPAQLPGLGVCVCDFNGDGLSDLFIARQIGFLSEAPAGSSTRLPLRVSPIRLLTARLLRAE